MVYIFGIQCIYSLLSVFILHYSNKVNFIWTGEDRMGEAKQGRVPNLGTRALFASSLNPSTVSLQYSECNHLSANYRYKTDIPRRFSQVKTARRPQLFPYLTHFAGLFCLTLLHTQYTTHTHIDTTSGGFCRGGRGGPHPWSLWAKMAPLSQKQKVTFSIKINCWNSSSTKLDSILCILTEKNNCLPAVMARFRQILTRVW